VTERRIITAAISVVVAAVALSACSASGSSSATSGGMSASGGAAASGGSSASSGSSTATGSPIVIADDTEVTGSGADYSAMPKAEQVAVDYLNASGGVGGHPLKLITCDTKYNAAGSLACAQQAVAQNPVAILGEDDFSNASGADALYKSRGVTTMNMPNQPTLAQSTSEFAIGGGATSELLGMGEYWGKMLKVTNAASLALDIPVGHNFTGLIAPAAKAADVSTMNIVYFPDNNTDFSAQVAQVTSGKPQVILPVIHASQLGQVWGQLEQQGVKASQIYDVSSGESAALLKQAGSTAVGVHITAEFANPSDTSDPQVKTFDEAMQKYGDPSDTGSAFAEWGFANIMFLDTVAKAIGPDKVTAASVKQYLSTTLRQGSTKTIPVFLGSPATGSTAVYPGIHRPGIQILTWNGTKFVTTQAFFDPTGL
jgi:branched-chain amino acid transport system substrate-binding protein